MSEKLPYTAPEMEIFGAPDSRGDLIFREAAKAVLENRYRIRTHLHDLAAAQQLKIAEWEIADLPAADVRPVVLCRDCVHFSAHSGTGSGYCGFLDIGTSQEAFCSHGEREES